MGKTNINWTAMSDTAIVEAIAAFVKHKRLELNKTQAQLAKEAGLNTWTVSQFENGAVVKLATLIQLLRVLDILYVLDEFSVEEQVSPLLYAKMQKNKRQKASGKDIVSEPEEDLGW